MPTVSSDNPQNPLTLAVVEDDAELRERILVPALQAAGFQTTGFARALDLYREWTRTPFALVLLDVGLPDEDGIEIATHLRTLASSVGIVMYSGHGQSVDRMRGLRAGVDAYLVKPVEIEEVIETLRNVGRRVSASDGVTTGKTGWSLVQRGWVLQTAAGASVMLSQAEREVVGLLVEHAGEPVTREALISRLTCDADGFDPHRLEMLIYRLRRKCLDSTGEALALRTVRGAGYMLDW